MEEDSEGDDDDDDDEAGSSSGTDEEEEDEEDLDEDADPELRRKIEEALAVNGIHAATGSDDESEEEYMDDDQMMAIDAQLAAVFKARADEKKFGKGMSISSMRAGFTFADRRSRCRCSARSHSLQKPCAGPRRHVPQETAYKSFHCPLDSAPHRAHCRHRPG